MPLSARHKPTLKRRVAAEALGTGMLLAAVVGSGIMGDRLAGGNAAVALLANTLATGAALFTLIATFGPISGGHFNPVVTLMEAGSGRFAWGQVLYYLFAQVTGAFAGVVLANVMFGGTVFSWSQHARSGGALMLSEFVATFGLLTVIWSTVEHRPEAVPATVAAYISAAYWFTASTSFANPAVTLARSVTDTFAGIRLQDVGGFIGAQLMAVLAAIVVLRWLIPRSPTMDQGESA